MSIFRLVGHEIETPLVNAAGSVNGTSAEQILREVALLARTAIGAITVGSFTVPEQAGNEALFGGPVYYHDAKAGLTYNAMGLPNIGLTAAKRLMPEILALAHEYGKPVIASVAPTISELPIGDTLEQTKRLVDELRSTGVDLVEVNTSCPNTIVGDGRKPLLGYELAGMERLVAELTPLVGIHDRNVGVKLPPYVTGETSEIVPALARLFKERRVFSFLVTANSIPGYIARNEAGNAILQVPDGAGGLSGSATKDVGRQQLRAWRALVGDELEIVSVLGVDNGKEVAVRQQLGATAAGGVTFLWEQHDWRRAVADIVYDWAMAEQEQT